ncbi:MAG TPA: hypothetical protein VMY05_06805 [Acidobacteriota bacterium]|nr:hypothetical protein [Acidobacteriota bacterium]
MSFLKGGINLPESEKNPFPEEEQAVLEKLARKTIEKGMTVPAILFLESVKPLNFIGSQILIFFEPIVQTIFNFKDYNTFRSALEKRESIEFLITRIEAFDAVAARRDKAVKKWYKQEKKNWKWYQRYIGVFRPKVRIPEEILNPPAEESGEIPSGPGRSGD